MSTGNEADNERSEVFNRLINCIDLVQIEARYQYKCRIQFFSTSLSAAVLDKKDGIIQECITLKKCEFLDQEGDLQTLKELHLKTCELAESTDAFTFKCLKNKLKEKYREHIYLQRLKAALILCVLSTWLVI